MSNWYYEKKDLKNTPSIRDGLDYQTEMRYRGEGVGFIMECGKSLQLGCVTIATGAVYFHRFYMFQSFKLFSPYVTACCCLYLAGKSEDTPKRCDDIIRTAREKLSDQKFMAFGDNPKEEIATLERILLQTIKFDLQVEHPYGFLVKYAKCLKCDQVKVEKMVQKAWNFVNDSLTTTLCLQWEPEIIAVALIHLATKCSKFTVSSWVGQETNHCNWWDTFIGDLTIQTVEDICHQVLDIYHKRSEPKYCNYPSAYRKTSMQPLPLPITPPPPTPPARSSPQSQRY